MKLKKLLSLATIFVLLGNTSAYAQNKRLMYEGFRQGTSWKVYLLNKKLAQEIKLGGETRRLYLVDLEIDNSDNGIKKRTDLVQCSTEAPFVAFKDDYSVQTAILHYINPGGEWSGYNQDSHLQYWVICHDLWKPFDYDLKRLAKQFGYSMQLESTQVEIPYGSMDKLK
ncbi:MAG: hypothetical protein HC836_50060 [Richelia sp. RM2_1_2]|nr:hypothetical protein [Richelia sp. RM2_1_2]